MVDALRLSILRGNRATHRAGHASHWSDRCPPNPVA